jgi:hypothetical protein
MDDETKQAFGRMDATLANLGMQVAAGTAPSPVLPSGPPRLMPTTAACWPSWRS